MSQIIIIGVGLSRSQKPGMAIPAVVLFEQLRLLDTGSNIQIIGLDNIAAVKKNEILIKSCDIAIINSLATLLHDGSGHLLKLLRQKKVFLYLHETEYVLDYSSNIYPQRMAAFWRALPQLGLLCSTCHQQLFYHKLGLVHTAVVFNSLHLNPGYNWQRKRVLSDEIRVVMIGSIQKRKGAAFFDEVANKLTRLDRRYRFMWIGGKTDRDDGDYQFSECVEWVDRIPTKDIYEVFARSDIFFLSSIDDPLPLTATEAAAAGLRIVAYEDTGTHETLYGCKGYVSFSDYSPECAVEAIRKSITDFPTDTDYKKASALFTAQHFAKNFWSKISNLMNRMPMFDSVYEQASMVQTSTISNNIALSPLLIAYGVQTDIFLENPALWLAQINYKLDYNGAKAIAEERSGQISSLYGFEVVGVAKLLLICGEYKKCCELIVQRIHSGLSVDCSVAITLAALNCLHADESKGELLGSWFMPRILERIKANSHQPFIYNFAAKVLMKLGYSVIAERYAKRAIDLSRPLGTR